MIRFHKEGYKIISITFIIAIAIILGAEKIFHTTLAIKITQVLTLGFVVLILQFFRNPNRKTTLNDAHIIAPVDGKVVVIEEVEHENLKREGTNIHYDLYISYPEAVLGTNKEVETVSGKVKIKIDAGTQSGKILRLKGKGLPSIDSYGKGDMFVHVNVWTPQKLTPEQKEFFETQMKTGQMQAEPSGKEKSFFDKVRDMFS